MICSKLCGFISISLREKTLPTTNMDREKSRDSGNLVSLSLRTFTIICSVFPAAGFIFCVVMCLLFNFEASTATHCQVANYLPSISAAIGYVPQRYIWRTSIALISGPLYLFNYLNYNYFSKNYVVYQQNLYQAIIKCSAFLGFMETNGLIGLTYISSTENYSFHEKCFIVFIFCSLSHMLLSLIITRWANEWQPLIGKHLRTYLHKRNTFIFNLSAFCLTFYFFLRHNAYCEPGIYSLFALCEYLVVLSNIYYHAIDSVYLFNDREVSVIIPKSRDS